MKDSLKMMGTRMRLHVLEGTRDKFKRAVKRDDNVIRSLNIKIVKANIEIEKLGKEIAELKSLSNI